MLASPVVAIPLAPPAETVAISNAPSAPGMSMLMHSTPAQIRVAATLEAAARLTAQAAAESAANKAADETLVKSRPTFPKVPPAPDLRRLKDERRIASRVIEWCIKKLEHDERKKVYAEVLYPQYRKAQKRINFRART